MSPLGGIVTVEMAAAVNLKKNKHQAESPLVEIKKE